MRCPACNRDRANSIKRDPDRCRAHLHGYVGDIDRVGEAKLDCWRARMHTAALHAGLAGPVELTNRLRISDSAIIRPVLVVVPFLPGRTLDPRLVSDPAVPPDLLLELAARNKEQAEYYDVHVRAVVDGLEYADAHRFSVLDPIGGVAHSLYRMVEGLALKVLAASVSWAS